MKKVLRIMALVLALSCLLSATAFATKTTFEEEYEFAPGKIIVGFNEDVKVEGTYEELLPEIKDEIESIEDRGVLFGHITLIVYLKEETHQASLDAVEALKDNPNIWVAEVSGYVYAADGENTVEEKYEFAPGKIIVGFNEDVKVEGTYEELLPEIKDEIESIEDRGLFYGHITLIVYLKEETHQASLDAVEALKDNPNIWVAEVSGYVYAADAVKGDANGDGVVSNADVIIMARSLVGLVELTAEQLSAADMDADGAISNADLVIVAKSLIA